MNYKWTMEQVKSVKVGDTIEVVDRFNSRTRKIKCRVVSPPTDFGGWWLMKVEYEGKVTSRGTHCCDPHSINKEK